MSRRFARRTIAAPLALWVAITAIDADAVHHCPVHSVGASGHVAHTTIHAAHGAVLSHGTESTSPGAPEVPDDHPRSHNDCTCPGACCGPQAFTGLALPAVALQAAVVRRAEVPLRDGDALVATDPQVVLPPALGPPTLHL